MRRSSAVSNTFQERRVASSSAAWSMVARSSASWRSASVRRSLSPASLASCHRSYPIRNPSELANCGLRARRSSSARSKNAFAAAIAAGSAALAQGAKPAVSAARDASKLQISGFGPYMS
jgi:hypothetical protein